MPARTRRLRVIAGPNGSGKSTIINTIRGRYRTGPFVNADVIEAQLKTNGTLYLAQYDGLDSDKALWKQFLKGPGASWLKKAEQSGVKLNVAFEDGLFSVVNPSGPQLYDAAIVADFIRYSLLHRGQTFTFETVLSDDRKLDFLEDALKAGYKIYLYFVCTVDPAINVSRVAQRVIQGGHDVPEKKIRERYDRSLALLPRLIPLVHRCYLFDNSAPDSRTSLVAEVNTSGSLSFHEEDVPWWIWEHVVDTLF